MKGKTILLISPEPWGTNFVSKHHYANYLSQNNTVYFLNPVASFSKNPFKNIVLNTSKVNDNLTIVNYTNLVPALNNLPKKIQAFFYKIQAKKIQKSLAIQCFDIIWSFDPYRYFNQKVWKAKKTIYHTVDFHPSSKYEKDIVLSADYFFGVAQLVLDEHASYRKGALVAHAADVLGFEHKEKIELPGNNEVRAVYTGNFHRNIDYNLLQNLAVSNPNVDFIMIGPTANSNLSNSNTIEADQLKKLVATENIYFIGSVPSKQLMSYIEKCDINLVLFKKEREKLHCSPHKLMGYFYSGNITISNYIDAHKNTDQDIIKMVSDQEEIPDYFSKTVANLALHNQPELRKKRLNYACENSYFNKIEAIGEIIFND